MKWYSLSWLAASALTGLSKGLRLCKSVYRWAHLVFFKEMGNIHGPGLLSIIISSSSPWIDHGSLNGVKEPPTNQLNIWVLSLSKCNNVLLTTGKMAIILSLLSHRIPRPRLNGTCIMLNFQKMQLKANSIVFEVLRWYRVLNWHL